MAYEGSQNRLPGIESGALALSASQFQFVQLDTAGRAILAATAGQMGIVGVLQDKPALTGNPACIANGGVTKVITGSAITAGGKVTSDASGKAISAAATSLQAIVGRALEAATAAGATIAMIFQHEGTNDI